ncbi:MAG: YraN family protein [Janthinobacterium lividum]
MTSPLTGSSPLQQPDASLMQGLARTRRGGSAWQRGMAAEEAACSALRRDGWTILLRRARTPCGEIDIVAERLEPGTEALLAFVEVKARPILSQAAASVSARQQKRLLGAGQILLGRHPEWTHGCIRFDVLLVDAAGVVRRITDAFRQQNPS